MTSPLTVLVAVAALAVAGCGDSAGKGAGRAGDSGGPGPAGNTAPPDTSGEDNVYSNAIIVFEDGDFDTAIAAMKSLGDYRDAPQRLADFRRIAARKTLATAKSKLAKAPQAAVSQTETSLKYHPTQEAREFLKRARKALKKFQAEQRAKGQIDGATPPSGKGPDGKGPPGKGEDDD